VRNGECNSAAGDSAGADANANPGADTGTAGVIGQTAADAR
jgi:hypothetical protein